MGRMQISWVRRATGWLARPWRKRIYSKILRDAVESDSWSESRFREYNDRQLVSLVRFAAERIPFYRHLYSEAGVDVRAFRGVEDLHKLPTIEKSDVAAHGAEMVLPGVPAWKTSTRHTGGSTGFVVQIQAYRGGTEHEKASIDALWQRVGARSSDCMAILRAVVPKDPKQTWEFDAARNRLILLASHVKAETVRVYVELMKKHGVQWLHAYPSSARLFAVAMENAGIPFDVPLRGALFGSENFLESQRDYFRRVFDCPVFAHYGHAEGVVLAGWCERTSDYHFLPTYGYAEFLAPGGGGPARPGEMGEIVGTGFGNRYMPFIRYRTNDFAMPAEPGACPGCGRWHIRAKTICGRGQDLLIAGDGTVVALTAVDDTPTYKYARQFHYYQEEPGRLTYHFVPAEPARVDEAVRELDRVFEYLRTVGLEVRVQPVDVLPATMAGKGRYVTRTIPLPWETAEAAGGGGG